MSNGQFTGGTQTKAGVPQDLLYTKSIGGCIVLSIITFGIYSIYWYYTFCKKIKLLNDEPPGCAGEVLLSLFIPFYGYYWMYTRSKKLSSAAARHGVNVGDNSVVNLLLSIFCLGVVAYALIQNDLNTVARTLQGEV